MTAAVVRRARGPAPLNRFLLAVVGLLLAGAGAGAMGAGAGEFGPEVTEAPPVAEAVALVGPPWVRAAAGGAAAVLALAALAWVLQQVRNRTATGVNVDEAQGAGEIRVASSAVRSALAQEVGTYAGVHKARVQMLSSLTAPVIRFDLTVDHDADVTAVWRRVRSDALTRFRDSMEGGVPEALVRFSALPRRNRWGGKDMRRRVH